MKNLNFKITFLVSALSTASVFAGGFSDNSSAIVNKLNETRMNKVNADPAALKKFNENKISAPGSSGSGLSAIGSNGTALGSSIKYTTSTTTIKSDAQILAEKGCKTTEDLKSIVSRFVMSQASISNPGSCSAFNPQITATPEFTPICSAYGGAELGYVDIKFNCLKVGIKFTKTGCPTITYEGKYASCWSSGCGNIRNQIHETTTSGQDGCF